ncbi:MAG: hypothetical protein CMO66_04475 [Verrucomicrobiales bacterium]|nr:hypothetical protein [Verrucomicrobiales bacterium]
MRWIAFYLLATVAVGAAEGNIAKVLPHYLDKKGRHTDGTSLLHRDVYQRKLREDPSLIHALRFDIKWSAADVTEGKLRVEIRSSKAGVPVKVFEAPVKPAKRTHWTSVLINPNEYKKLGKMESWRVTLLDGGTILVVQKSFLW